MKTHINSSILAALLGVVCTADLHAQTTAFTYQGRLTDNGIPINGSFDITFGLWNAASGPSQVGGTWTNSATVVSNGLFTATVDFGSNAFTGLELWLQLGVRTNGVGNFSILSPRQLITATPYAIKAANAMNVNMGSISNPSFIGTTTSTPLELFVNNQRALRIRYNNGGTTIIGGSRSNQVDDTSFSATIAGGGTQNFPNTIGEYCEHSAIGGGVANQITYLALGATIAGGTSNHIGDQAQGSSIGGGNANRIGSTSMHSFIGGGNGNHIENNASYSVVPGGTLNTVGTGAANAMAAGSQARAYHSGTFVWADATGIPFTSTAPNQFLIRAAGGVGIHGTLNLNTATYPGVTAFIRARPGDNLPLAVQGTNGVNFLLVADTGNVTVSGNAYAVTFNPTSDRTAKENFQVVSPQDVLAKVAALPIQEWNFKSETGTRHIGPMAQDFYAAFGVGPDDKHIATVDADGVALAAIQGLNQKVEGGMQKAEVGIQELRAENAGLRHEFQQKETEIAELRRQLNELREIVTNITK